MMQQIAKITGLRIGMRLSDEPPSTKVVRRNAMKTFIAWEVSCWTGGQDTKKWINRFGMLDLNWLRTTPSDGIDLSSSQAARTCGAGVTP
jgi:hypothetical protein